MGLNRQKLQENEKSNYVKREYPEESWFPERGISEFYVLRTKEDEEDYRVPVFIHKNKNSKGEHDFLCLNKHGDEPCYACEKARELFATGDKRDEDIARFVFYHKKRSLMNVVVRGEDKTRVFLADQRIDKKGIYAIILNPENPDITDEKEGTYLILTRKEGESGGFDEIFVQISRKDVPLPNWKERMAERFDMEEVIPKFTKRVSYEEMKAHYDGKSMTMDEEEDQESSVSEESFDEEQVTEEVPPCFNLGKKKKTNTVCKVCSLFETCDVENEKEKPDKSSNKKQTLEDEVLAEIEELGK